MVQIPRAFDPTAPVLILSIGNTNTSLAIWHQQRVLGLVQVPTLDTRQFETALNAMVESFPSGGPAAGVVASVVPKALADVQERLRKALRREALVIGDQIRVPIDIDVDDPASVGVDRLCNAAAAFERLKRSCAIVGFGTAVTVDLVNDEGVFLGGAILPGLRLQLSSLHMRTAQLPEVEPGFPDNLVGRNTREAMQNGVCRGLAGAVRWLVEAYATQLGHWPQTIATGGDAILMAEHCDFLDNVVPDLGLRGVGLAYTRYIEGPAE